MKLFNKILIANRGEIATRIIKAAQGLGIIAVAIFAEDDRHSLHVSLADEAFPLGDGNISETYLNIPKIIEIAVTNKCTAIHPGYGFLSENCTFAKACENHDIVFVGPSLQVLQLMGDKAEARKLVKSMGIPVLDGFECSLSELQTRKDIAYPVMIKPAMGGGGKGMHVAHNLDELLEKVKSASREAANYFANDRVYFEKYIEFARHIEVQVMGDHAGNVVHLFDRECTIQRNFQKIMEEAPSPSLNDKLRKEITNAAVCISKAVQYSNAGTVEFLLDNKGNWYFIEMNTRIQVEHPVTEAITGIDLVKLQLQVASGYLLPFGQEDVVMNGHAIELRINAEDPARHFRPSSGNISLFKYPDEVRFDSFIQNPYQLTATYDSLLGKMIVIGKNRAEAIQKSCMFIQQMHILGIETNISFLKFILENDKFITNQLYTKFCSDVLPAFTAENQRLHNDLSSHIPVIAFTYLNFQRINGNTASIWQTIGYWRSIQQVQVTSQGEVFDVAFQKTSTHYTYTVEGEEYIVRIMDKGNDFITISNDGNVYKICHSLSPDGKTYMEIGGFQYQLQSQDLLRTAFVRKKNIETADNPFNGHIRAPLHGRVVKINCLVNGKINRGDVLLVIESMKTENHIVAPHSGTIKTIHVAEGNQVKDNMLLMEMEYFNV